MKIILLGASGIIGREIDRGLSQKHKIVRAGRSGEVKVDYTDTNSVKAIFEQIGKSMLSSLRLAETVHSNPMIN